MESRWFNTVVVLFWLTTMSWLVVVKVLPPLSKGEPPNYQTVFAPQGNRPDLPVGWTISWNDRPLGWAVTKILRSDGGVVEVRNRVHFDSVPLDEMAPKILRAMLGSALDSASQLKIDADSRMEIDRQGKLSSFQSRLCVPDMPDAIQIRGSVEGSQLTVNLTYGNISHPPVTQYLPPDALLIDELSPQARLPGLHVGQTWTVPVCSPLRPERAKVEILQASVEGQETISWNGKDVAMLIVVYRADSGSGFRAAREPRGKLWVDDQGTVLKQECNVYNSRLTFLRQDDEQAADLVAHLPQSEWFDGSSSDANFSRPSPKAGRP